MTRRDPSYRLHKSSGRAVCTINGIDHYLGRFGSRESKAAYRRLIQEWEATGKSSSYGASKPSVTLAMLMLDYVEHCEKHYPQAYNSETKQTQIALRYLADYQDCQASEFGPLRLKAVRETMIQAPNKITGKPVTRQYVNRMIDRICRMFRWGAENELVNIEVYRALANVRGLQAGRTAAPEAEPISAVDDAIVDKTLPHCSPIVADMIRLQRLTGMRPAEVCCLTPGMIDRSGHVWVATLPKHKTAWRGKNRAIYLGPQAQQLLLKYMLRAANAPLFSPAESEQIRRDALTLARVTPASCGNSPGTNRKANPAKAPSDRYDTGSYRRAIHYACSKAFDKPQDAAMDELEQWKAKYQWSPNQLRHAAATQIRKLYGLEAAQVILGHSSANVTQIYAEVDRDKAMNVALAIG